MTINNITYLNQFIPHGVIAINNPIIDRFNFWDIIEITKFIRKLDQDKVYVINFEFVYSCLLHEDEDPVIKISKPILVTKNSDPKLISDFLKNKVDLIIDLYYLDDEIIKSLGKEDSPSILVKFSDIRIF
jgi:hypothetical protein